MAIRIESHNQKGGLTANKVNLNSQKLLKGTNKNSKNAGPWNNPWFKYVLIPLIVAIIAGLIIWSVTMEKGKKDEQNVYVTSYDQKGGITANQVNIGNQPRTLTPELKTQLDQLLQVNKNKEIRITAVLGDGEAFQFANQIKAYLESKGWKVSGVDQAVYSNPVMGQTINPEATEIIIGTKQ